MCGFFVGRHVELSVLNISIAKPISIMEMNRKIEYINECITFILIRDITFEFESNYIILKFKTSSSSSVLSHGMCGFLLDVMLNFSIIIIKYFNCKTYINHENE